MWLNLLILGVASLVVGIVIGWIAACPRRWDAHFCDEAAFHAEPADHAHDATDHPVPHKPCCAAHAAHTAHTASGAAPDRRRVPVRERVAALAHLTSRA